METKTVTRPGPITPAEIMAGRVAGWGLVSIEKRYKQWVYTFKKKE